MGKRSKKSEEEEKVINRSLRVTALILYLLLAAPIFLLAAIAFAVLIYLSEVGKQNERKS